MNSLEERADDFVTVNYGQVLDRILSTLARSETRLFKLSSDGRYLQIAADQIAQEVASNASRLQSPLGAAGNDARVATTHFGDTYPAFAQKVRQLNENVAALLDAVAPAPGTTADLIAGLCTPLRDLTRQGGTLGLHYPFDQPYTGLKKQRLTTARSRSTSPTLRLHRVTVTVDHPDRLMSDLEASLREHITDLLDRDGGDELDRGELEEVLAGQLADHKSDVRRLCALVNTESMGKIQRETQVRYLEFLRDTLGPGKGATLLADLIRRLRLIEHYLGDPDIDDAHYQVHYAGSQPINYRDLFARGDAFDQLPIIPVIQGQLGETTDAAGRHRTYHFGLRLKLGGRVNTAGPKGPHVFDYVLDEYLDTDGKSHQLRRDDPRRGRWLKEGTLRVALLYFFALRELGNLSYDPVAPFEAHILPALQSDDETRRRTVLRQIRKALRDERDANNHSLPQRLAILRTWLHEGLRTRSEFPPQRYPFHLLVKRGLLEQSMGAAVQRRSLLSPVIGRSATDTLRYLAVGEPRVDASALCKLTGSLTIDSIHFTETEDEQQFSMAYAVDGITALPVFLGPKATDRSLSPAFRQYFGDHPQIQLPYHPSYLNEATLPADAAFCYRLTFALLTHLSLSIIAAQGPANLFLPLVRLHLDNKLNPTEQGTFIRSFAKVLAHMLGEDHRATSQGIDLRDLAAPLGVTTAPADLPTGLKYRARNALSSLYGALPKRFTLPAPTAPLAVDRMAILIVSSRECDQKRGSNQKKANLLGEIVGIARQPDGTVEVTSRQTFSDVYHQDAMYRDPTVLIDVVGRMYEEGYRHFLYIARSPYSSTLHMTAFPDDDHLFFMSRSVIDALRSGRPDLKLYPVFFDMYPVVRRRPGKPQSLYIQDTWELTQLMEDPSKRTVMFFNLFNGKVVREKDDPDSRFYNGVIAYSTLLNMYDGVLDDRDIYLGLLDDSGPGSLKDTLLTYLTLFHFARYEGAARDGGIVLKLDPYQHLIGDDSVGRHAMTRHMAGSAEFNLLAFLTEVRKVTGGSVTTPA